MSTVPNALLKITKYVSKKARYARERDTITPRNGCELVAGVVARVRGGPRQKELSLEDQVDHAKEVVSEYYEGPVELRAVATTGKGEDLERPELRVIEEQLRSRELDLLIGEDVGRIVRGAEASRLIGIAFDHGTRFLAPNDCIDSNDDDWESDVMNACGEHVKNNTHTSKRIKQKKQNRFRKFGGATPCEIAGYEKPSGAPWPELRLPRLWVGFRSSAASFLRGDGPEFDDECTLRSVDPDALFHGSARNHFGLTLYPLDWVSSQLDFATAVFAEVTPGLRRQICCFNGLPDGLIGYRGGSEFDFYNSRFRKVHPTRRRHCGSNPTKASTLATSRNVSSVRHPVRCA